MELVQRMNSATNDWALNDQRTLRVSSRRRTLTPPLGFLLTMNLLEELGLLLAELRLLLADVDKEELGLLLAELHLLLADVDAWR